MEAITPDGDNPLYPTPPILPAPTKARNQTGFKNRAVLSESDRCQGLWTPRRREQKTTLSSLLQVALDALHTKKNFSPESGFNVHVD